MDLLPEQLSQVFSFMNFNEFQKSCIKPSVTLDDNLIITSSIFEGVTYIPEFSIIKVLNSNPYGKIIFYVMGRMNSAFDRIESFTLRYEGIGFPSHRIKSENFIPESKTQICFVSFNTLISFLRNETFIQKYLNSVSLIIFDEMLPNIVNRSNFLYLIYICKKLKIRIVGNCFSTELQNSLSELLEAKILCDTTNPHEHLIKEVQEEENIEIEINRELYEEVKSLMETDSIIIITSRSSVSSTSKALITLFEESEKKKIVAITNTIIYSNVCMIWKSFEEGQIKVIVTSPFIYFQYLNETHNSNYKLIIRSSKITIHISYLLMNNNNQIIITNNKSLKLLNYYDQCNQPSVKTHYPILPTLLLSLFTFGFIHTMDDVNDLMKKLFDNSLEDEDQNESIKYLIEKQMLNDNLEVTELGKITAKSQTFIDDTLLFISSNIPKKIEELLMLLCLSNELKIKYSVKEEEIPKLRTIANDPNLPFYNIIDPNKEEITISDKTFLLLQRNFTYSTIDDPILIQDFRKILNLILKICNCFLLIMEYKKSFNGIYLGVVTRKCLNNQILNENSPKIFAQFPGFGGVFSSKIFAAGIHTYNEFADIKKEQLKNIIGRSVTSLYEKLKKLPKYKVTLEKENDSYRLDLYNEGGFIIDGAEHFLYLLVGNKTDDSVYFYEKLNNVGIELQTFHFSVPEYVNLSDVKVEILDSKYVGIVQELTLQ